jgi:hypothetical protein
MAVPEFDHCELGHPQFVSADGDRQIGVPTCSAIEYPEALRCSTPCARVATSAWLSPSVMVPVRANKQPITVYKSGRFSRAHRSRRNPIRSCLLSRPAQRRYRQRIALEIRGPRFAQLHEALVSDEVDNSILQPDSSPVFCAVKSDVDVPIERDGEEDRHRQRCQIIGRPLRTALEQERSLSIQIPGTVGLEDQRFESAHLVG